MTKEEIAKRFCKFELCTHRNGEGMCCLFNQDNCIFHRLEKENVELKKQIEKMKCCGNCAKYNSGYGENPCKISASVICGEWETSIGKF